MIILPLTFWPSLLMGILWASHLLLLANFLWDTLCRVVSIMYLVTLIQYKVRGKIIICLRVRISMRILTIAQDGVLALLTCSRISLSGSQWGQAVITLYW